jgi:cobalt-zinc-cadmium efflux system protein
MANHQPDPAHGPHHHPRRSGGTAPSGKASLREGEARRLSLTLLISLAAVVAEGLGGYLANSLSLLSDAGHMLADAGAIALSLFALRVGARPADAKRTYGYYRLEIIAALVNGAALIAIAIGIVLEAVQRLRHPEPVAVGTVVVLACVGIALNGAGLWLTHAEHGSMNLRGTFLHLAGDLLNSIGVLMAAAIIYWTGRVEADPIISFVIAGTIVWSAVRLCREAVDVLLEGVPAHLDFGEVSTALASLAGVSAVHDLHVWTITSGLVALSCHIVVECEGPGCRSHDEVLTDAKAVLRDKFHIEHTTIQFESESFRHEEVVH